MKIVIGYLTGQDQGTSQEFSFEEILIGRSPDNDIVLDHNEYRMVSRRHATIRAVDGEYVLFDEASANGTFINGTETKEARLAVGDRIMFGKEGPEIEITYLPTTASLVFAGGPHKGDKRVLSEEPVTVGRDDTNDIVFSDYMVSRAHARIEFRNGEYWLIDNQSKNGTYVEGRKIDRVALKHGQVIRFGFEGPEMKFEGQKKRVEGVHEVDTTPKSPVYKEEVYKPVEEPRPKRSKDDAYESKEASRPKRYEGDVYEPPEEPRPRSYRDPTDEAVEERRSRKYQSEFYEPVDEPRRRRRHADEDANDPYTRKSGRYRQDAYETEPVPPRRRRNADRYPSNNRRPQKRALSHTEVIVLNAVKSAVQKWQVLVAVLCVLLVFVIGFVIFHELKIRSDVREVTRQIQDRGEMVAEAISEPRTDPEKKKQLINDYRVTEANLKRQLAQLKKELYIDIKPTKVDDAIKQVMVTFGVDEETVPEHVKQAVVKWMRVYKPQAPTILARRNRYWPKIKQVFKEKFGDDRLAENLAYIAWVESDFKPDAVNEVSKASGMWQFMVPTALEYGLVIDSQRDDRFDPDKATEAAAKYIDYLLNRYFGGKQHFMLAVASYNYGQGNVRKLMSVPKGPLRSFEDLYWSILESYPKETKDYIPKFIAAVIIGNNPEILQAEELK